MSMQASDLPGVAMQDYTGKAWVQALKANGLDSFESIWALDIGWVEEPNKRRGGWSGVSKCSLDLPDGGQVGVFIKRQQDHVCRTFRHPLRGIPTFSREFHFLMLYQSLGIPTLEPVYFAQRQNRGEIRAILVTRELEGYSSLADCELYWREHGWPALSVRNEIISCVAATARQMHQCRIKHNCFFTNHVFVGEVDGRMDARIIDLEKTKRSLSVSSATLRDLDTLNRRAYGWRNTDRLRFLLAYYGQQHVDSQIRKTWRKLAKRMRRKGHFPASGR